ncbi:hypothetical protein SAMN04488168_107121 [Bacillus sp. 491mf]|uniref:hypothetical protein n=1 Tax=Bacillus TaxID=1386 RepID=UPI00055053A9|nr:MULTISPECIES: hypothetical protein [unclassified Bacillus (in: firmicutes)]SFC66008.1 hypothetical protein SAMN04488168_107121 [Bacillus sp. 491mf]
MEWLLGMIGVCSVILLFMLPGGLLSSSVTILFVCSIICTIIIIMLLIKRSKVMLFFGVIVMTFIVIQIITLFIYPTIIEAFQ